MGNRVFSAIISSTLFGLLSPSCYRPKCLRSLMKKLRPQSQNSLYASVPEKSFSSPVGLGTRMRKNENSQHVLFPTINNNCKLYIVLQLIIIVNFRAILRTKQCYWTGEQVPPASPTTHPLYANFALSCSSVSNCCGAIFSSTIYNYCKSEKNV